MTTATQNANQVAARRVLIAYEQLCKLLELLKRQDARAQGYTGDRIANGFNQIFRMCMESFSEVDPTFAKSIEHLGVYSVTEPKNLTQLAILAQRIEADGVILRGTLEAFLKLYLSREDREKTIGFTN